jgi:phospholipid/cholesterol/gamma-HCH transport system ATP-binding protein
MNHQTPIIEVKNLKKSFNGNQVLRGVNLKVNAGESTVIIGGSGCGKSVLIKCILGLLEADSGSIKVTGEEMVGAGSSVKGNTLRKVSMLFQGSALFDSLPVWQNVAFLLLNDRGLSRSDAKELAIEKLKLVGLSPNVADLYPDEVSGGMKRRVALARAIAHDPKIIFFDEPTTGLDPIMTTVIHELILKCVSEVNATAITITHHMEGARHIADSVHMLHEGKMIWNGKPDELADPHDPYLRQFVLGLCEGPIQLTV